jgi:hypothetical protein
VKSLAPNNRLISLIWPIFILAILFIITFVAILKAKDVIFLAICYLLVFVWIWFSWKRQNLYYDNEYLYIKGIRSTSCVPIRDIRKLKHTMLSMSLGGFGFSNYAIEFRDGDGNSYEVHFWVGGFHSRLLEFEKFLEETNPYAKIQHWATN